MKTSRQLLAVILSNSIARPSVMLYLIVLFTSSAKAQWRIASIDRNSKDDFYFYRFPYLQGRDTIVARKINAYLQSQVLYRETVSTDPHLIFEEARYNDSIKQTGFTSIEFTIGVNNKNVVSIRFDMETLAAYPEHYTEYYNFDNRTGDIINTSEIFSEAGIRYMNDFAKRQRRQMATQFIKKEYLVSEDSAYICEQYGKCLEKEELGELFIDKGAVLFHMGYCFPHIARPYDTDLDIKFSVAQVQPYLSAYGKELLLTVSEKQKQK